MVTAREPYAGPFNLSRPRLAPFPHNLRGPGHGACHHL